MNIIIGAGITGLAAGYFSKEHFIIFEKENTVGGLCKSFKEKGFTFDCSGHFLHIKDIKIKNLIEKLIGQKLLKTERNSAILFKDKIIPFPFQANLFYLDDKEKKDCVDGIKNRKDIKIYNDMPFIDWSKATFGTGITKYFMQPYNQKLWNYNLKKLTAAWTAPFVPKPTLKEIETSAYKSTKKEYGYNSVFYYPKAGGCQTIVDGFYKKIKSNVCLNIKTEKIDLKNKRILAGGKYYFYDKLISTQPLKELLLQTENLPKNISSLIKNLQYTTTRCINIGIKYKRDIPDILKNIHWLYAPEKKYPFYRIGVYSNISPSAAPKKCFSLYIETTDIKNSEDLIPILKKMKIIRTDDEILSLNVIDMKYSYVIYNKERTKTLNKINKFLLDNDIYSIGRYGGWEYSFIEKNIISARKMSRNEV